ncbi:hypothetical protein [Streptomyces sp. NPDC057580]|uniref:hypothetical protein n=1 Tax=Streptomyces sp. NPDC057580 TaxID=3346173 RepID=UPI0036CD4CAD
MRVLGSGRSPRRTAWLSDVYAAWLPQELTDRIVAEVDLPDAPVVHLRAYDTQHNTFRYRLTRPAPVAGIGLHDPKAGEPKAGFEAMLAAAPGTDRLLTPVRLPL